MRRLAATVAVLAACAAFAEEAPAASTAGASASAWAKAVDATGYLALRGTFTRSRTWGLLPTDDQPQAQGLVELNTQVKVSLRPRSFVYSDVSLVANRAGVYHGTQDGQDVVLDDHQTAASAPVVSLNEVYALHEFTPALNVLVGKKRITWGSGAAYNPTDLLNPRRDPTDPTSQRAGAWVAQVEAPLENVTLSLLFAPTVLMSQSGLPTEWFLWPKWNEKDREYHYQTAARLYALIGDADVTVMLFYGNKSVDDFREKLRVGLSFSRYFFTDYELHLEALLQQGSTRQTVRPSCVANTLQAIKCAQLNTAVLEQKLLDDKQIYPRVLVGTRRQFSDDSMLSVEYLYQADGWTKDQYQAYADGLDLLQQGRAAGLPVSRIPGASSLLGTGTSTDGVPQRFSFDPRGQHYAFLSYQKPRIFDDWTASLVVVTNLTDLSTLLTPSVSWATTEWLTLSLYGFLPLPGPDDFAAKTANGHLVSEYGVVPFAGRVMFEARAFF